MLTQPDRPTALQRPFLWIALSALLAIVPLLLHGTSCGHDLNFHLQNWMEAGQQWRHGTLRPFWCFSAAWNAGEPRFVFYPPISWSIGALLGLILPWTAVPTAFTFLALLLSGLTMHRLLRRLVPPATAILGACVYLANPYMLFVAYERAAEGELLAAGWMPLLLSAVLRPRPAPLRIGIAVALLWLTNAPAAVVGSYALLLIAATRLVIHARANGPGQAAYSAGKVTSGYVLGLALSSFYLLPAIVQRRSVQIQMAVLPGMRPADNFLFGHTGEPLHDAVLHAASWIAVAVLAAACASSAWLLIRCRISTGKAAQTLAIRRAGIHTYHSMHDRNASEITQASQLGQAHQPRTAVAALCLLTLAVAFLLTPASTLLWRYAPELTFLQFPWRFLAVEAGAATVLFAMALPRRLSLRLAIPAALVLSALFAFAAHSRFAQPCDDEDAPRAQRAHFLNDPGTEPTDEYTPTDADNDALHPPLPPAWLAETDDAPPPVRPTSELVTISDGSPAHLDFRIAALPSPMILVVRLRGFRGWRIQQDGVEIAAEPTRDDGLISIPLTPGTTHQIDIHYGWTWDEFAGLGISATALLFVCGIARWRADVD